MSAHRMRLFVGVWLACSFVICGLVYGDSVLEVETVLPELPAGVVGAGDVELTEDRLMTDINIPGLERRESRWQVDFYKRISREKASTLDKEGARKLADAFLDHYFPSLSEGRRFRGCGTYSTSQFRGEREGQDAITGYSVSYNREHRSIPILNDRISVTIKGDEVVGVQIRVHRVKELAKTGRLLTAEECLARSSDRLAQEFPNHRPIIVKHVTFGYRGGLRQHWEDDNGKEAGSFVAMPVYELGVFPGRKTGMGHSYVFDARTAELVYPRKPEGGGEVEIAGPELVFEEGGSKRMFLIGPRDIEIKRAVFEMESAVVEHSWDMYSVREVFTDTGQWQFDDIDSVVGTRLVLRGDKGPNAAANGWFNVEIPGKYEVELLVYQKSAPGNIIVRNLQISIDGESREMGTKGPNTARTWEEWGTLHLTKGEHKVTLQPAPGSRGGEIGGLRIRRKSGVGKSSVKDLKIDFSDQKGPDYYSAVPPAGHFETTNLSHSLKSGLRYGFSDRRCGCNVATISVSSASPGILQIHSLRISFVCADEEAAGEKAGQFVLIYPEGGSSRALALRELKTFGLCVEDLICSAKGREGSLFEVIRLCGIVGGLCAECEDEGAKEIQSAFRRKVIGLVGEEAHAIVYSFQCYSNDWPKPADFPSRWAEALVVYRIGLDPCRLTEDGGYLDPWGNPYMLKYFAREKRVQVVSRGANGKDDAGGGDDIEAEGELEWFR